MRRFLLLPILLCLPSAASAGDHPWLDRFVQRAPRPLHPPVHTMERAGYPQAVHSHAIPSLTSHDYSGYVGGGSIRNNRLLARGPGSATGPLYHGTYGTDFGGFGGTLARVFLASSTDPSRGYPFAWNYLAEGPRLVDIGTLRPLRKAVLEKRADAEERGHGHHGHGHAAPHCEPAHGAPAHHGGGH